MCLKTAFALWFLLGLTEYANAAAAVDDNAIVNLAMENYYAILNESGAYKVKNNCMMKYSFE